MIVNRHSRIGLFEMKAISNEKGLFVFDFNTREKKYLDDYLTWEGKCICPIGHRIAITAISANKKAYRTDLVVMEHKTERALFSTGDYYVYDVAFDRKGDQIMIVADKEKPFCYDLTADRITGQLPQQIRTYKGDLDLEKNIFIAPCEKLSDTCYLFDFDTARTNTIKLGIKAKVNRIKFSSDFSNLYVVTETNVMYCLDRSFRPLWSRDFNYLGKQSGRINSSDIFSTEDGELLSVYTTATETNTWGKEYILDSKTGDIVGEVENYQSRGRFATNFFNNKVLLHSMKTLDLKTQTVAEEAIF